MIDLPLVALHCPIWVTTEEVQQIASAAARAGVSVEDLVNTWVMTQLQIDQTQRETSAINITEVSQLVPGTAQGDASDQGGP